jgi:hypothetical protein
VLDDLSSLVTSKNVELDWLRTIANHNHWLRKCASLWALTLLRLLDSLKPIEGEQSDSLRHLYVRLNGPKMSVFVTARPGY